MNEEQNLPHYTELPRLVPIPNLNPLLASMHLLKATFVLLVSSVASFQASVAQERPNVLFIAVDDMNDWVSVLDSKINALTPNLDSLAASGLNFTNAHTPGTYCAPARSAIFTGQFASTTGFYQYQIYHTLNPELVPLQSSFQAAGYNTYGTGKLFNHPEGAIDLRDWSEFYVRTQRQRETGWPMDTWEHGAPLPPQGIKTEENRGSYAQNGLRKWGALPNEKEGEMADTLRTEWAITKLQETHDKPFFLALGLYAPHIPNYAPQKYYDLYDRETLTLPEIKPDDLDDLPEPIRTKMIKRAQADKRNYYDTGFQREAVHSYLACISYADAMIGRLLDALDASPYAKNTLVVFWSDHGYHYGEKGHFGKKELWERTSNIPFIWRGPGVANGKTTNATASLIDMYPTFVELCALPQPLQKLEGVSLAATLQRPEEAQDRTVYLPYLEPNAYAMINSKWRYIKYANDTEELYDVQADPNEWRNLASNPGYQSIKDRMRSQAPKTFTPPAPQFNTKKQLVIDGETFHWNLGDKNRTR